MLMLAASLALAIAAPVRFAALPAHSKAARSSCATHPSGHRQYESDVRLAKLLDVKRQHLRLAREDSSQSASAKLYSIADQPQLLVPMKFIVMHNNNKGKVERAQIEKQVAVMDEGFSGAQSGGVQPDTGARFKLESVQYVNNAAYYQKCERNAGKIQKAYVKEPEKYLYVIVCHLDYLGASSLPEDYAESSNNHYIQLLDTTLPGGSDVGFNLGDTLVHEVGHYFGLEHTFEKGCKGQGDYVSDTPAVKVANEECTAVDSCPGKPGMDAIENFMDYTPDTCMDRFSPGQVWRIRMQLSEHKPGCVARWTVQGGGETVPPTEKTPEAPSTQKPETAKPEPSTQKPTPSTQKPATAESEPSTQNKPAGKPGMSTTTQEPDLIMLSQHDCRKPAPATGKMWMQRSQYARNNGVCAASSLVPSSGGNKAVCFNKQQQATAEDVCIANGARLCSVEEIKGKVAVGSGCGMDFKTVWTSTQCVKGFMAIKGNGAGAAQCLAPSSSAPSVRCCADNA